MENPTLRSEILAIVNADAVTFVGHHHPDDLHDESLHAAHVEPFAVVRPSNTQQVSEIAKLASRHGLPLTPRGSGTGLSGAATPVPGGIVISFSRMNQLLEVDVDDHVAVVQPGITLLELNEELAASGLRYPVYPGELSGSLGGNVNTNAGGMRAVRHGVTRQHVLGLELVLIDGTVVRTGARVMKSSSGYDLTQLIVGSEGTLALVTEITLRLSPQLAHAVTILIPFRSVENVTRVVPSIVASGLEPSILEYLDVLTMSAITSEASLELGVAKDVAAEAAAYLIVMLETRSSEQLEFDVAALAELVEKAEALDVYVLAPGAAIRLIAARERAFWVAKASGANEIIDIVVPRSSVPSFLSEAGEIAERHGAFITGCGHVGDGNVHLSVFLSDEEKRRVFLHELFSLGVDLGGLISGEHGIGRDKQAPFLALTDPTLLTIQRKIKAVFDPEQLLNPYRLLDDRPLP
ncbi:MAG: FAD-linked oxidase C-terminal domain-containing protein [Acidimicrobiales bacterium]|jgi:glycolate oxidase